MNAHRARSFTTLAAMLAVLAAPFAVAPAASAASRPAASAQLKVWGDPQLASVECEDFAWSKTGSRTPPTDTGPGALTIVTRANAAFDRLQRAGTRLPKMQLSLPGAAPVTLHQVAIKNKSAYTSSSGSEASGNSVGMEQVTLVYERIDLD